MSISWDENQLTALSVWISDKLPLLHGEVTVATMDIPENCFAGQVDLDAKEFVVFTNMENSMSDTTVNVFLGYIVALAYDKGHWDSVPDFSVVVACHSLVCLTMLEFNEDFSKALEENIDVLESWYATTKENAEEIDEVELAEEMSTELFSGSSPSKKNYNVN